MPSPPPLHPSLHPPPSSTACPLPPLFQVLNLLKGAAPYIQHHPVWVSICGLLKIIQYDPASFPVCVETMAW